MIRTSLTMSIGPDDARTKTFLVNGAHLGLLSPATQNIHVQTNHKPLQLIFSFTVDDNDDESEKMENHRRQIEVWQAFTGLLSKRGCSELHALLNQYNLTPEMLLCLTEMRLQAWIPQDLALYLLRDNELRRIRPVEPRDMETVKRLTENMSFYSISLRTDDHFLLFSPELTNYFASGEIAGILSGLRQLPAKMSDLFNSARLRGYTVEKTWLAWQILRLEPDQKPPADDKNWTAGIINRLAAISAARDAQPDAESDSEYLTREEEEEKKARNEQNRQTQKKQKIILAAVVLVLAVALVFGGIKLFAGPGDRADETTRTEETTTAETTRRPSPTPTLTPTPEPTTTERSYSFYVSVRRLNLRAGPNQRSDIIATLNQNDRLEQLTEAEGGWIKVRTEDDLEGYVFFNYIAVLEPDDGDEAGS